MSYIKIVKIDLIFLNLQRKSAYVPLGKKLLPLD